jgi:hypothetical protein
MLDGNVLSKFKGYIFCGNALFYVILCMKTKTNTVNIAVSVETHQLLISHIQVIDGKIGKFTEKAIREKIEREKPKQAS